MTEIERPRTRRWPRIATAMATLAAALVGIASLAQPAMADLSEYQIGWSNNGSHYLINPDGTNNQFFGPATRGEFDWTDDGLKLVYSNGSVIRLKNQNDSVFTVATGGDPAISPDGMMVAYAAPREDANGTVIKVVDLAGNELADFGPGRAPAWSRDGTRIAFTKPDSYQLTCPGRDPKDRQDYGLAVATMPETGFPAAEPTWVLEPGTVVDGVIHVGMDDPDWSPDGSTIVYQAYPFVYEPDGNGCVTRSGTGDGDVLVISSGGGAPTNLTEEARFEGRPDKTDRPFDGNPSFSPDGSTIAFASSRTQFTHNLQVVHTLWLMSPDGGSPEEIHVTNRVDATDWRVPTIEGDVVRIGAPGSVATEANENAGSFAVSRTGPGNGDLEVTVAVVGSSTATAGVDYETLPTKVIIPDGSDSVTIPVRPIDDDDVESDETVVLELTGASGYILAPPTTATVTILDDDEPDEEPVVTTVTETAPAGSDTLPVQSNEGFEIGDEVLINPGGDTEEHGIVAGFGSLILEEPLQFDHAAGEQVINLGPAQPSTGGNPGGWTPGDGGSGDGDSDGDDPDDGGDPDEGAGDGPRAIEAACPTGSFGAGVFGDVAADNVHAAAVECLADLWEIIRGTGAGAGPGALFGPDAPTTRAQMASLMARLADAVGKPLPSGTDAFDDDDGSVHEASIDAVAAAGIALGTEERILDPGGYVRRDQMASFLARTLEHLGVDLEPGVHRFTDIAGNTHADAIAALSAVGIVTGTSPTTFDPAAPVRRDQTASFVARALALLVDRELADLPG